MQIRRSAFDAIVAHARRDSPRECCGLLVGVGDCVSEAVATTNVATEPMRRYEVAPAEHFALVRRCRNAANGSASDQAILGVYHSHPHSVPVPSATDTAEAFETFLY